MRTKDIFYLIVLQNFDLLPNRLTYLKDKLLLETGMQIGYT